MPLKYYLLSSFLIALGCTSSILRSPTPTAYHYIDKTEKTLELNKADCCFKVQITRIIDGDTFEVIVDHGFRISSNQTFRLWNYEAPELRGNEAKLGKIAKEYLQQQLPVGSIFKVRVYEQDSFGRWLIDVLPVKPNGFERHAHLTDLLIDRGYGLLRSKDKRPVFNPNATYPLP